MASSETAEHGARPKRLSRYELLKKLTGNRRIAPPIVATPPFLEEDVTSQTQHEVPVDEAIFSESEGNASCTSGFVSICSRNKREAASLGQAAEKYALLDELTEPETPRAHFVPPPDLGGPPALTALATKPPLSFVPVLPSGNCDLNIPLKKLPAVPARSAAPVLPAMPVNTVKGAKKSRGRGTSRSKASGVSTVTSDAPSVGRRSKLEDSKHSVLPPNRRNDVTHATLKQLPASPTVAALSAVKGDKKGRGRGKSRSKASDVSTVASDAPSVGRRSNLNESSIAAAAGPGETASLDSTTAMVSLEELNTLASKIKSTMVNLEELDALTSKIKSTMQPPPMNRELVSGTDLSHKTADNNPPPPPMETDQCNIVDTIDQYWEASAKSEVNTTTRSRASRQRAAVRGRGRGKPKQTGSSTHEVDEIGADERKRKSKMAALPPSRLTNTDKTGEVQSSQIKVDEAGDDFEEDVDSITMKIKSILRRPKAGEMTVNPQQPRATSSYYGREIESRVIFDNINDYWNWL